MDPASVLCDIWKMQSFRSGPQSMSSLEGLQQTLIFTSFFFFLLGMGSALLEKLIASKHAPVLCSNKMESLPLLGRN